MPEEINIQNQNSEDDINEKEVENTSKEETTVPRATIEAEVEKQSAEATTPTQATEDMEIHHHSHHQHKKQWKDYFFEFFMLFLAVTLGFIVENLREHYVEHQRAKEYAQSLCNDLKKDSAWLNTVISLKQWRSKKLDSLIILMKHPDLQNNARELYYYSCFLTTDLPFKPYDVTIQQLRNSGTLRYFTSVQLYNIITQYYNDCNFYIERENESRQMTPPLTLTSKIFSTDQLMLMIEDPPPYDIKEAVHWPAKNEEFKLLSTDRQTWNEYSLYVREQKGRNELSILLLHQIVEKHQSELMTALKKEYHVN